MAEEAKPLCLSAFELLWELERHGKSFEGEVLEKGKGFFSFCILKNTPCTQVLLLGLLTAQAASDVLCTNVISHRKALK